MGLQRRSGACPRSPVPPPPLFARARRLRSPLRQVILAEHKPNPNPNSNPNPNPNQVILAEHKPAWDDALRVVVDVGFDSMSSLSDVSEVAPKPLLT